MTISLTAPLLLCLLAWGLRVLARRAWDRMPLDKTPSPYDRSQRRNRAGAVVYDASRARVVQARVARRRTVTRTPKN